MTTRDELQAHEFVFSFNRRRGEILEFFGIQWGGAENALREIASDLVGVGEQLALSRLSVVGKPFVVRSE